MDYLYSEEMSIRQRKYTVPYFRSPEVGKNSSDFSVSLKLPKIMPLFSLLPFSVSKMYEQCCGIMQ